MSAPTYLICLECESPCYGFEWNDGEVTGILCEVCGNEDCDGFATEDEIEAMGSVYAERG